MVLELIAFPPEIVSLVVEELDVRSQKAFRLTCTYFREVTTRILFRTVVVDFSVNLGRHTDKPWHTPIPRDTNWNEVFRNITTMNDPGNRNWSEGQCQTFYARMIAPRTPARSMQPRARVEDLLSNPDKYRSIIDHARKLVIRAENINDETFPTFANNWYLQKLASVLPRLKKLDIHINICCEQPRYTNLVVFQAAGVVTLVGVQLGLYFYGNFHLFGAAGIHPAPLLLATQLSKGATTLETNDYVDQEWHRAIWIAMRSSQLTMERLAVGSGPIHPFTLDDAFQNVHLTRNGVPFPLLDPFVMSDKFKELEVFDNSMLPTIRDRCTLMLGPNFTDPHVKDQNGNMVRIV